MSATLSADGNTDADGNLNRGTVGGNDTERCVILQCIKYTDAHKSTHGTTAGNAQDTYAYPQRWARAKI